MAQTVKLHAVPMEYADGTPRGDLRAFTRVPMVDIFGREVFRRVNIGTAYSETLETARNMVRSAREANKDFHVEARFTVDL